MYVCQIMTIHVCVSIMTINVGVSNNDSKYMCVLNHDNESMCVE